MDDKKIKDYKFESAVISAISIIVGIVLVIFPGTTLKTIGYLISGALLIIGLVSIIIYLKRANEENFMKNDFLAGLVLITLGICAFIKVELIIDLLPIILGVIVIITGCKKLQETIDMIRSKNKSWFLMLILSAINIALGVVVVCNPFNSMKILVIMIGAGLIYSGITEFFISRYVAKKAGESSGKIIDM